MLSKMANQIGLLAESVAFHSKVYTEFAALYWPLFSFTVSMEPFREGTISNVSQPDSGQSVWDSPRGGVACTSHSFQKGSYAHCHD